MWPVLKWVLSIDVVFQLFNVKEASWKTHETLTAWGHANGLL
jgi:hypothetical protein